MSRRAALTLPTTYQSRILHQRFERLNLAMKSLETLKQRQLMPKKRVSEVDLFSFTAPCLYSCCRDQIKPDKSPVLIRLRFIQNVFFMGACDGFDCFYNTGVSVAVIQPAD